MNRPAPSPAAQDWKQRPERSFAPVVRFMVWLSLALGRPASRLVLYLIADFDAHAALLARLGKHTTGKACLYIKRLSDVDVGVLRQLIGRSVAAMEPRRVRR